MEAVSALIVFKARNLDELIRELSVDRGRVSRVEPGTTQWLEAEEVRKLLPVR